MPRPPTDRTPAQPHDALVKWTFSQNEHAAGLLKAVVGPELVLAIDWDTVRLESGTFVDKALRGRHGDLLFSARLGEDRAYFYALIEHQRDVEPLMIFRVGTYMMRLWERLVRERPGVAVLPPIFPILLHHSDSGWTAPIAFQDVVGGHGPVRAALVRHIPHFELRLIDLSPGRASHLVDHALTELGRLVLWCLSVAGDDARMAAEIGRFTHALDEVLGAPNGTAALEVLLRYLAVTHASLGADEIDEILRKTTGPVAKEAIVTFLDEIRLRGELKGERRGERKGREAMLIELLEGRFGPLPAGAADRVRAAGEDTLAMWTKHILTAPTLEAALATDAPPAPARRTARKRSPRR